jgi:hypothetical protein
MRIRKTYKLDILIYSMKKRVEFPSGKQKEIIKKLKKKSKLTWKELACTLQVKEGTLSKSYLFELCNIPYNLFKKMILMLNANEKELLKKYCGKIKKEEVIIGRKVFGEQRKFPREIKIKFNRKDVNLNISEVRFSKYDLNRKIKLPNKITPKLAEEIGMHFGDGFLSEKRYDYRLKGNPKNEKEYYKSYIKPLFKDLYNIDIILKESWKSFGFELQSKAIWEFKTKVMGIKPGKKYEIKIPEKLKVNNRKILCGFIRGLFDTDGSLRFKSQYGYDSYYPIIEISLTSKELVEEVVEILEMLGFNIWNGFNERYGRISINGIPNFKRYKELIGWSSEKNLKKVKMWEEKYPNLNL